MAQLSGVQRNDEGHKFYRTAPDGHDREDSSTLGPVERDGTKSTTLWNSGFRLPFVLIVDYEFFNSLAS